jgi:hypothetical protein
VSPYNRNHARHNNKYGVAATADNDEDDIEILEDYCTVRDQIISYSIIHMHLLGSKDSAFGEQ